ncbi:hypothetical protein PTTG_05025 [Puccinia triticina 1-1 BBBD Race 1]|uniref:Uncharacterized protein n=1 Tax=Puccinia triticina (isolate 1-1 / race 1 (BBBD)) TaxID=630390 RepID=A0A0C4EW35_PUCT1|nr:hypothetical protein PTTG_05025 [Puccinia triticina 1-1 BBBD Race 1]
MTNNTRSHRPELRGPLPPPTRPRGGKGAPRAGQEPPGDADRSQGLDPRDPRSHPGSGREVSSDQGRSTSYQGRPASDQRDRQSDGRRRARGHYPYLIGSYPETPFDSRNQGALGGRSDKTPGKRARFHLEIILSNREQRPDSRAASVAHYRSRLSESASEAFEERRN